MAPVLQVVPRCFIGAGRWLVVDAVVLRVVGGG